MRRFSLRTLIVACVLVAILIGYYREPIVRLLNLDDNSAALTVISSATEMDDALASPNAIIFAHVDWSASSVVARSTVTDFALHWHRNGNAPHIDFYFLDLTDAQQNAPAHISKWLSSDTRLSGLPIRGSGDVVWLKNGAFQKWLPAYDTTVDDLNTETETILNN